MILIKVKININTGRRLAFSFMVAFLQVFKKGIFRDVFSIFSNAYDEVFLAKVVNVSQPFTIFAKMLCYNPKYA